MVRWFLAWSATSLPLIALVKLIHCVRLYLCFCDSLWLVHTNINVFLMQIRTLKKMSVRVQVDLLFYSQRDSPTVIQGCSSSQLTAAELSGRETF